LQALVRDTGSCRSETVRQVVDGPVAKVQPPHDDETDPGPTPQGGDSHRIEDPPRVTVREPWEALAASKSNGMWMTVMESRERRAERIEALRGLLDRLCAPDLTLAEAKVLREIVYDLLEQREWGGKSGQAVVLPSVIPCYGHSDE
jgi:hypothetical protein